MYIQPALLAFGSLLPHFRQKGKAFVSASSKA